MGRAGLLVLACLVALSAAACRSERPVRLGDGLAGAAAPVADIDFELAVCRRLIARALARPALPGSLLEPMARAELLGRAKGEPVLLLRAPRPADPSAKSPLREGYLYHEDPAAALRLVATNHLGKLFDAPTIWLLRGSRVLELTRVLHRGRYRYQHRDGSEARLLLFDRVATSRAALDAPLHRDVRRLRDEVGFDRLVPIHLDEQAVVADLHFDAISVRALLENGQDPGELRLGCLAEPRATRERVAAHVAETAGYRRAVAALRGAADRMIAERLPFDRPRGATDHLTDGQLRPQWRWAYKTGRFGFVYEEQSYPVFDPAGRPFPPQMCVELVVDTFERAAGTWYPPRDRRRAGNHRTVGRLDFERFGIGNRAGVLAFEKFAQGRPDLFESRRVAPTERVPFAERRRFFASLAVPGRYRAADIVAIHGLKQDGNVHQHAILIDDTDPLSGFPCSLVDQMSVPRRRTWEGIMAEAPRRSLLYHLRPTAALLALVAGP